MKILAFDFTSLQRSVAGLTAPDAAASDRRDVVRLKLASMMLALPGSSARD